MSKLKNKEIEPLPQTTAIILSGGAGRRIGGLDKGLQNFKGKPLIQWVLDAVEPQVEEVVICINRNIQHYNEFSYQTVLDIDSGYQGPIGGIISALQDLQSKPSNVLIVTCDTPLLPNNLVKKLNDALMSSIHSVAVVNDGKRNQNLHCLIKQDAVQSLLDFYADGGRAMHKWYKKIGVLEVEFSEQADCFLNINSTDQLI